MAKKPNKKNKKNESRILCVTFGVYDSLKNYMINNGFNAVSYSFDLENRSFQKRINEAYLAIARNHAASYGLKRFFDVSDIEIITLEGLGETIIIDDVLPEIAPEHANRLVRSARRAIKSMKRSHRTSLRPSYAKGIVDDLDLLEKLKQYEIDRSYEMGMIETEAFQVGVIGMLNMAKTEIRRRKYQHAGAALDAAVDNSKDLGKSIEWDSGDLSGAVNLDPTFVEAVFLYNDLVKLMPQKEE